MRFSCAFKAADPQKWESFSVSAARVIYRILSVNISPSPAFSFDIQAPSNFVSLDPSKVASGFISVDSLFSSGFSSIFSPYRSLYLRLTTSQSTTLSILVVFRKDNWLPSGLKWVTDKATLSLCPICLPFTLDSHFAPILERGDMRVLVIRCIKEGRCCFLVKRFLQSLQKYVIHVDKRFSGDGAVVALLHVGNSDRLAWWRKMRRRATNCRLFLLYILIVSFVLFFISSKNYFFSYLCMFLTSLLNPYFHSMSDWACIRW